MNIHFNLRQQGKTDPVITLQVFDSRFKNRKFMHSTGKHIRKDRWDKRKERARVLSNIDELSELNKHLDRMNQAVIQFLSVRHDHKTLSRQALKAHLNSQRVDERKTEEETLQRKSDFFGLWQQIIDTTKGKDGINISAGTKRSKKQTLSLVRKYCIDKKVKLTLEALDMSFYYALDIYMEGKGLNPNTRGKHFKEIKAIIREAQDRDHPVNLAYLKKSFKVIRKDSDSTYLNETEIRRLIELKLSGTDEKQRDIFVMACFVGARHSDWHQIRHSNIVTENGKELLRLRQQKTSDAIHIPVHPVVRMILAKYKGEPPRVISNQKFNDALKNICQHEDLKLGKIAIDGKQVEKWTEISTHTARRSFATNAYLSRTMDVYQIMKCTGHRTEASFLKYLKLNGKDFAMQAADSKFFSDTSWSLLAVSKAS
jgi:integrase